MAESDGGERMTIRQGADALLAQTGLPEVLAGFGRAEIVGSYVMDAMAWNDLDVYVALEGDFHTLAAAVMQAVKPVRFDGFCDVKTGNRFIGMETMATGERWNIDIWIRRPEQIDEALERNRAMKAQLDACPEAREAVVRIKQALIARGMYGLDKGKRHYHSAKIYEAVLEKGVLTVDVLLEMVPV